MRVAEAQGGDSSLGISSNGPAARKGSDNMGVSSDGPMARKGRGGGSAMQPAAGEETLARGSDGYSGLLVRSVNILASICECMFLFLGD